MMFEEAARQHKRHEKVEDVLKLREGLAHEIESLHGVAITASAEPQAVELWMVREGHWQAPERLSFQVNEGKPEPLDRKLREVFAGLEVRRRPARERQEYLALLARWFYASWREGEWLPVETFENPPYRKLVHAISRVAQRRTK